MKETMSDVPDVILETLQADVRLIKTALLGDEYRPEGLLKRVDCIETEQDTIKKQQLKQENRFNRILWVGTGVGTAVGTLWAFLGDALKELFKFGN